jgi:cell division protein FtsW
MNHRFSLRSLNVPLWILVLTVALTTVGLVMIYSASATVAGAEQRKAAARTAAHEQIAPNYHAATYLKRQAFWVAAGLASMAFFSVFDYRRFKSWGFAIMLVSFVLCLLVWAPGIGVKLNGANRWIRLGPLGFQPSELAKLGLIIYMAKLLDKRHAMIESFTAGVFPATFITLAFCVVILLQPDFGSAFVLFGIIVGMWICGEVRVFHLAGLGLAAAPLAALGFIMQPYRVRRLFAFLSDDPEMRLREGFQLEQSLIAVGSGGLHGLGLGDGIQKHHYLFAGHTDFIFAIIAEELGFIRVSLILLAFMVLVMLGWRVALNTSDFFGSLLATGITLMIMLGATIHMGVALGMLPTKGLVLPFMSYGGTSLLVTLSAMGILINIASRQFSLVEPPPPVSRRRVQRRF